MRSKLKLAAAVAAGVVAAASQADAALLMATFKGVVTIDYGSDMTFGVSPLVGQAFTAVWTFDPTLGNTSVYVPLPGYFSYNRAGYNDASPVRSVAITINGITDVIDFTAPSNSYGETDRTNNPEAPEGVVYFGGQAGRYIPSPTGGQAYDYFSGSSNFYGTAEIPFDMGEPWNPPSGSGGGAFARTAQNSGRGYDQAYNFAVSITSGRISEVGAIPEPATWTFMIAGFGTAGAVLRRRRLARAA